MSQLWSSIHAHFIPSQKNAYRPHLLHRSWLLFFLALMLGAEGFLMTGLIGRQSNEVFLAAVAGSTPTLSQSLPGASPISRATLSLRTFVQQTIRVVSDPRVANGILGGVAGLLTLVMFLTFFVHIQIQPKGMLAGAGLLVALALLFLYSNTHFLLQTNNLQMAAAAASL